jgi:hypothetical protein
MNDFNLLLKAIDDANPHRLRKTLRQLCVESPDTLDATCQILLSEKNASVRPRYAQCQDCKAEFDTTNGEGDCTWHPGTS